MPDSYAQTPEGLLLVANGVQAMLRWDGLSAQMETAGVKPPATAPTISASGVGAIVGEYTAFVRFVDDHENVSNLSPTSNTLHPQSTTGTITNVGTASPLVVTSPNHGLLNGAVVKISGVGGATGANNTWTITVVDANRFSLNGSVGGGAYTGGGTWTAGAQTINYTNLPLPTETKVRRRQILRNTEGQASTYYVDIDTTDLDRKSVV